MIGAGLGKLLIRGWEAFTVVRLRASCRVVIRDLAHLDDDSAVLHSAIILSNKGHIMSTPPRARDLFQFDGTTGQTNSIVDVRGVLVGHANVTPDSQHPFTTGVTAILPQGYEPDSPQPISQPTPENTPSIDTLVPAAWFTLNGDGEMTGTHLIEELGLLEGPIMLTNTLAVGTVRNAVIDYALEQDSSIDPDDFGLKLPVVAETDDSWLNESLNSQVQVTEPIAFKSSPPFTTTVTGSQAKQMGGKQAAPKKAATRPSSPKAAPRAAKKTKKHGRKSKT